MSGTTSAMEQYLQRTRLTRSSGIESDERSYYPALDILFNTVGVTLAPKVVAIHDVADRGAGHPDYALQVETTKDTRAVVEAKLALVNVNDVATSQQVRRYLAHYGVCLVTNLRDLPLVQLGGEKTHEIMRYSLDEHYSAVKANTLDVTVPASEARFAGEG